MKKALTRLYRQTWLVYLIIIAVMICLPISRWNSAAKNNAASANNTAVAKSEKKQKTPRGMVEKFSKGKDLLVKHGVPFNPYVLLTDNWRKTLQPHFNSYPEFRKNRQEKGRLSGVIIANTLSLPELVELDGDTVIIARNIEYEGQSPLMKSYGYDIYIFIIESGSLRKKKISQNQSPQIYKSSFLPTTQPLFTLFKGLVFDDRGLDLTPQGIGDPGKQPPIPNTPERQTAVPAKADNGVCGDGESGKPGALGFAGLPGSTPAKGGRGGKGKTGGTGYISIGDNEPGANVMFTSNGTRGGVGADGQTGGRGGEGGKGGNGGDGVPCCPFILGAGGPAGMGGTGGTGGDGGDGGDGGEGGDGGDLIVSSPLQLLWDHKSYLGSRSKWFPRRGVTTW